MKNIFSKSINYAFLLSLIFWVSCQNNEAKKYEPIAPKKSVFLSGKVIPDSHFLGDDKCKECHQQEYKNWSGSHHDKAMQIADSTTVLANFNNVKFTRQGVTSRFFKKENNFYVNTEGPDGKYHDYKIVYTFGLTPLQQYIVQFPNGHYQCLRTAWDSVKNKWFDLYPDFKVVHSEWLHWSRGGLNWNNMCADCHSTNVRKNYEEQNHSYNTKYTIINVSCEACHGPGKQHVTDVNQLQENYTNSHTFKMTANTPPKKLVDECARCHMRREQFSEFFNFEGTLLDHYYPQLIEENLYEPDGKILDEVYVYGSFLQSKMYQNDVTCTNCHNAHSLKLKFTDNKLCTQCHVPAVYDTPKHHFHPQNTKASKCINCHMTGKTYMGNDYRRDHSFRVPRPDLSLEFGTTNACTDCHKDKDNVWAAKSFKKLYGEVDSIHFSDKLAPGLARKPNAHEGLLDLVHNKKQPDIIRASAAKALENYNAFNFVKEYLELLKDDSALVRGASIDVLSNMNTKDYVNYFLPLLEDPKRSIRIKAFFALASLNEADVPQIYVDSYQKVKKEFFTHLKTNADFVGGQVKKALYYLNKNDLEKAIANYEKALVLDNINNQVRTNLANLYYQNKQYEKAAKAFKIIIKQEPKFGPTYYSLGLMYAEIENPKEAVYYLEKASELMPKNIRIYYNLGLLYNSNQQTIKAEKALKKGLKIDSNNESLLYALAFMYANTNQKVKAKKVLEKLVYLYPNNQQYKSFLNQL